MFRWMQRLWHDLRLRRENARRVAPQNICSLAGELKELAELAERTSPVDARALLRLRRIRHEMDELMKLTRCPEFTRLSIQRRLELHDSLTRSLEQILASAQASTAPTARLQ